MRFLCISVSESAGQSVMQLEDGYFEIANKDCYEDLKHLHDCTGWDWQEETFPQYWTTLDTTRNGFAFVVRTSKCEWHGVGYDGKHCKTTMSYWEAQGGSLRTRLTEAEALALLDPKPQQEQEPEQSDFADAVRVANATICSDDDLAWTWHCQIVMAIQDEVGSKLSHADANHCAARAMKMLFGADVKETQHWKITVKPIPPAESPDDWVEITDPEHVVRDCDQISDYGTQWYPPSELTYAKGKAFKDCGFKMVRCRRRDLPAKAPAKRRVSVPMWLISYEDGSRCVLFQTEKPLTAGFDSVEPAGTFEVEVG